MNNLFFAFGLPASFAVLLIGLIGHFVVDPVNLDVMSGVLLAGAGMVWSSLLGSYTANANASGKLAVKTGYLWPGHLFVGFLLFLLLDFVKTPPKLDVLWVLVVLITGISYACTTFSLAGLTFKQMQNQQVD